MRAQRPMGSRLEATVIGAFPCITAEGGEESDQASRKRYTPMRFAIFPKYLPMRGYLCHH
jgi:hypothetical protein